MLFVVKDVFWNYNYGERVGRLLCLVEVKRKLVLKENVEFLF